MPFNGSGTFTRIYNWVIDKANGINITASRMDADTDDIANGLSQCINKDGQTTLTANIPFNNYKITGLSNGSERNHSINVGQVQDNQFLYLGTTSGSADAYTLSPAPTITAYATTQRFIVKIHATNTTTTPYLQISGIANPTTTAVIKKLNASKSEIPVAIGDLVENSILTFQRNSTNTAWIVLELSNPATTTTQGIVYLNNPVTVSNNATTPNTDLDFTAGNFVLSDGSGQAISTAMTKRLQSSGAWTAGAGGNLLLSGSRAINSTYHVYAIFNPTTLQVDYGAILGVAGTAPNPTSVLPSGYTKYSKNPIFSLLTDASGNIRTGIAYFRSDGNYHFFYNVPVVDITGGVTITTERLQSVSVPLGLNILSCNAAYINVSSGSTGNNFSMGISNYNATTNRSFVVMATKNPSFIDDAAAKPLPLLTNTSGQLYFYTFASGNLSTHALVTEAWLTLY